jgi:hypothetical protein
MHTSYRETLVPGATARSGRTSPRRRWFRVKVQTDEAAYLGSLRLGSARTALHDLLADERAYLALWDATEEGSPAAREYVAIHKGAIRAVVLLGDAAAPPKE